MAKSKSRATRLSESISTMDAIPDEIRNIAEELTAKNKSDSISKANEKIGNIDTSEIEELKGEIESWREGMEGTNLESTNKYTMLEECESALQDLIDNLEGVEQVSEDGYDADEVQSTMEEVAADIESYLGDASGIEFPGMYS